MGMMKQQKQPASEDTLLAEGFRSVDSGSEAAQERCLKCLDFIRNCDGFQSARLVGYDALNIDDSSLTLVDGGCGPGYDSVALANRLASAPGDGTGLVYGVDRSETFVAEAQARAEKSSADARVQFLCGDLTQISDLSSLPAGGVDRVYVERTLQHIAIEDFLPTIEGIATILKPGGRFVAVEPNWELFSIAGGDLSTTRTILQYWTDTFNHGSIALDLPAALSTSGFEGVEIQMTPVVSTSWEEADIIYDLERTVVTMVEKNLLTPKAASEWLSSQKSMGSNYFCSLTMCAISATRS